MLAILAFLALPMSSSLSLPFAAKAGVLIQKTFELSMVFPLMLCIADMPALKAAGCIPYNRCILLMTMPGSRPGISIRSMKAGTPSEI